MDERRRISAGVGFDNCQPVYHSPAPFTDAHCRRNADTSFFVQLNANSGIDLDSCT